MTPSTLNWLDKLAGDTKRTRGHPVKENTLKNHTPTPYFPARPDLARQQAAIKRAFCVMVMRRALKPLIFFVA
ncbi:MAG: hypothetical protein H6865_00625 [Rhodospirillales bacterium]|nr:hypothetical protein [Rhodospirillales bacterium]USO07310.1 MAG: hypothetical protein H6866_07750 [Rhodospirillales bacterium]